MMITEVDIDRIMAAQRQLTESVAEISIEREMKYYFDEDEMYHVLDFDMSVSETNGLM